MASLTLCSENIFTHKLLQFGPL